MPLPEESKLAGQLFDAAQARATQHGFKLQPDVTGLLEELAKKGAETILAEAKAKPNDVQDAYVRGTMRVATEAMSTWTDEMTSARFRLPEARLIYRKARFRRPD